MTTKHKVARRKLSLLELASELNNVSRACQVMGYSRQQFYEIRRNVERLHRTLLDEHFRLQGRKKWYEAVDEMQKDLDAYLKLYNTERTHQGRNMNGRTPYKAFTDGLPKNEKQVKTETRKAA